MILKKLEITPAEGFKTNCYIIADNNTKEAMVVDPAGELEKITEMIETLNVNIKYIVLTHCHGDHISGVMELKKKLGGNILAYREAAKLIKNENIVLSKFIGVDFDNIEIDSRLDDNDIIHIGDIPFKVIYTPGHTSDSICLYCDEYKFLISGDTMFSGTWGRTDLPTSNFEQIISSITEKLMILPDETIVYPGHGKSTMIKDEKHIYLEMK